MEKCICCSVHALAGRALISKGLTRDGEGRKKETMRGRNRETKQERVRGRNGARKEEGRRKGWRVRK